MTALTNVGAVRRVSLQHEVQMIAAAFRLNVIEQVRACAFEGRD